MFTPQTRSADSAAHQHLYDVFLSHQNGDKPLVESLAARLDEQGLRPFLDKWHLIPGSPWQEALEEALDRSGTCAVFLGAGGLGPWENEEMRAALDERVRDKSFRVIPVLLPGAEPKDKKTLPLFLRRLTWVDFRGGLDDPDEFRRLVAGVRGVAPGHQAAQTTSAITHNRTAGRMWRRLWGVLSSFFASDGKIRAEVWKIVLTAALALLFSTPFISAAIPRYKLQIKSPAFPTEGVYEAPEGTVLIKWRMTKEQWFRETDVSGANANLIISKSGGEVEARLENQPGEARASLNPGRYEVRIDAVTYQLTETIALQVTTSAAPGPAPLRSTVIEPDGKPIQGAKVTEALKVYNHRQSPQQLAMTQYNLGSALMLQGERSDGEKGVRLLGEAVTALREALKVYSPEESPKQWAMTQNDLGDALRLQGERSVGEEGLRLLAEAVAAYREALKVYSPRGAPQQWVMTKNNLGNALRSQGERSVGEESLRLLSEAVTAFREALKVHTREHSPGQWAMTQNNLGAALRLQGERSGGKEGVRLLGEAVTAFREALKVPPARAYFARFPRVAQLPRYWAMTQNSLGNVLRVQGEMVGGEEGARLLGEAVTAFREALKELPSYEEGYQSLASIYHERLFEYAKAFELHQQWLSRFPQNTSALPDFAQTHFTTGRFPEFSQRAKPLLIDPDLSADAKIALQMIEVANLLALDNADQVPAALTALDKTVSGQNADFRITWSFSGALNFINWQERFVSYRSWLNQFFSVAREENRDAIVKALREAQAQFPALNSGQRK